MAAPRSATPPDQATQKSAPRPQSRFDIDEYRVDGADELRQIDVEEAVYPFLGPGRTADDIEKARAALEKAYHDKGYQTVSVAVAPHDMQGGVVILKVMEGRVGRLRVAGSRYYDLAEIKRKAPSLAEGRLPDFNAVTKDIVALNQWPDRKVTPALRAGVTPGTVDVDLNLEDKPPLHASVELNNRASPNTTSQRLTASARYENLWQLGHSFSFTYQVAPQRQNDALVFSGSYLARFPECEWLSVLVYFVKSKSDIATLGGTNVIGPGEVFGTRAVITLPGRQGFFHSLSLGPDYKHFGQEVRQGDAGFSTPVHYYPFVTTYTATWQNEGALTQLNAGITFGTRGLGSDAFEFDDKRFKASGGFVYFKGDLSHTQDLPHGFQVYGKAQGQISDSPLVSSEQFSAGGLDTVRGYFESEVIGDKGIAGTAELRSPDIASWIKPLLKEAATADKPQISLLDDWRVFLFVDAAHVSIHEPLPEQETHFDLASYGVGTRFKLLQYANGQLIYAVPMKDQATTVAFDRRLLFRVWGEF